MYGGIFGHFSPFLDKHSFAQRQRHLIDGQSRVIKEVLFAVVLGSHRTPFPSWA